MNAKNIWLYFHPYVHVAIKRDASLLYNTTNGAILVYTLSTNPEAVHMIRRINSFHNLYTVKIPCPDPASPLGQFIRQLEETSCGGTIRSLHRPATNVQLKPAFKWHPDSQHTTTHPLEDLKQMEKDQLYEYIDIIDLYINSTCSLDCTVCSTAYRQLPFCHRSSILTKHQLLPKQVQLLLDQLSDSKVSRINILGGNILQHSRIFQLAQMFNSSQINSHYYLHYLNIPKRTDFFDLIQPPTNNVDILVSFPVDKSVFIRQVSKLNRHEINVKYNFIIESEDHISATNSLIPHIHPANYQIIPLYTSQNQTFFEEYVKCTPQAITKAKPDMNEVLTRMHFNSNEFKKITVSPDGGINANINTPRLGKLDQNPIIDLIHKEIHRGASWTRVRHNVPKCKSCVYNALCPPIAGYEFATGKYDFCRK